MSHPPELKPPRDIGGLLEIMQRLRGPNGCPWDREQRFETIAPYTIEEAYEVASAIADNDLTALKSELGDLLFQVVFHTQMAKELGLFDFADVVEAVSEKMIRRHPHVFGCEQAPASASLQVERWEERKKAERVNSGQHSILDDVARALPALTRAEKLQKRASTVGFDWKNPALVVEKITEEAHEVTQAQNPSEREEEMGDLLFAMANLARHLNIDPEAALRAANAKFTRRFQYMEASLAAKGVDPTSMSLEELEELWQQAKRAEKSELSKHIKSDV